MENEIDIETIDVNNTILAEQFFSPKAEADKINQLIAGLRKKYLSVPDIKAIVHAQGQILQSGYPETNSINKLSSILSFIALKLSDARRYSADDIWCMDRGLGLFAGLNVLPKTGWYTSYSHRVTRTMNRDFLKGLHSIMLQEGLLSDTANIDFHYLC